MLCRSAIKEATNFNERQEIHAAVGSLAAPLELEERQSCADVTVYFARGTTEPGTVGTVVGPPFAAALNTALVGRSVEFVGVPYPATVAGYLAGGDQGGAQTMANYVTSKANSCPNTKIFISGYSQGAQVTHLAAGKMSQTARNRVRGAIVFGDPKRGQAFPSPIVSKTFCNFGDNICDGGIIVGPAHLTYGSDTPAAAAFVASRL